MKINEKKAIANLHNHVFAKLTAEEIEEFKTYCGLIVINQKLAAHVTAKDKPKIKTLKYIQIAKEYGLKVFITDVPNIESSKNGWKNVYVYKNQIVRDIIIEIMKLDTKSKLYNFALGKIFGYIDKDVIDFISDFH